MHKDASGSVGVLSEREFVGLAGWGHAGLRRGGLGLLSAVLVLTPMLVGMPQAQAVTYDTVDCLDAAGVVSSCYGTVIASAADIPSGTLTAGTYIVEGTFAYSATITISGDVRLVLADGYTLTVTATAGSDLPGVLVTDGNTLEITSQPVSVNMGKLIVSGNGDGAGIGGGMDDVYGAITINGGAVKATGGDSAAGIGAGQCVIMADPCASTQGVVMINDGVVNALGGFGGAGIGGGYGSYDSSAAGQVVITGGTVTASSGGVAAGIGGGRCLPGSTCLGSADKITISGGKVTATSVGGGAAIGGGVWGGVPAIEISGGTVNATNTGSGAGIGGGYQNKDGSGVTISGGTVNVAAAGGGGAGIGSGSGGGQPLDVTISGGSVNATGGDGGAGIGGGDSSDSRTVTISGGQVTAKGGPSAPGIGPGHGVSTTSAVTVMSSGMLVAAAGDNSTPALVGPFTPPTSDYAYWTNTSNVAPGTAGTLVPPDSGFVNSDTFKFVKIAKAYDLTVQATAGGSITVGASGAYAEGDKISLGAKPAKGYKFVDWESSDGGSFTSTSNTKTTFTMPGNSTTVTAVFKATGGGSVETGGRVASQAPLWVGGLILLAGIGLLARHRWARG